MPFFGAEKGIESFFYVSRENIAEKKEKPGKWHFRAKFDAVIELNALEGAVGGLLGEEAGAWGQVQGGDACGIR